MMGYTCERIQFGIKSCVPDSTLTSTPAPVTNLDWIKNEFSSRQAVWATPGNSVSISGTIPSVKKADFFSIAGSNLGNADTTIKLFNGGTEVYSKTFTGEFVATSELIPLGEWRAGVDPYGIPRSTGGQDAVVEWFDDQVEYNSFTIDVVSNDGNPLFNVQLNFLQIGEKLQLDENFKHGARISFMTPPNLAKNSSGSYLPVQAQQLSKKLTISLPQMTEADRFAMWDMETTLNNAPFIVDAHPSEPAGWKRFNYSFLGRFANELDHDHFLPILHRLNDITILEVKL